MTTKIIPFRAYPSDEARLDAIIDYLQEKEPQNPAVTVTDAIRYALFVADLGIEKEEKKEGQEI